MFNFLLCYEMQCNRIFILPRTFCNAIVSSFFPEHFAMQRYISFCLSFKIVVSMDLVSMVANDKDPTEIIFLTYFEIKLALLLLLTFF